MSSDEAPSPPVRTGRSPSKGKRKAIIEAAIASFFDRGYAATSIEQVAATAGVSKVTVYNQFADKRSLFTAAVVQECERIRGYFTVPTMPNGSLRERLTAIGQAMVVFLSRPEMVQFERRIAAETELDPGIGTAFLAAGPHRMTKAFAVLLTSLDAAGEISIDDPDLAAEQFAAMCKGMGDLERRFGMPRDERRDAKRIEAAVEVFCRAYASG